MTDTETPIVVDLGAPPKIEPPPELVEAAARAIAAGKVWVAVQSVRAERRVLSTAGGCRPPSRQAGGAHKLGAPLP
jgi:hypothetical protein